MDRSDVVTLLKTTYALDDYGVERPTITGRDVFCAVQSVTRAEFFEGGRNGLNPEYRITMFFGDYDGETLLEYNGSTYSVYRTYHAKTDTLELYVERKGGANGKAEEEENPA